MPTPTVTGERAATSRPLTPRQLEVAGLVAEGLTNPQIATRLKVSVHNIRVHVKQATSKIEGDLPARQRLAHWYCGGETVRLMGPQDTLIQQ